MGAFPMTVAAVRDRVGQYTALFDGHSGRILAIVSLGWAVIQIGRKLLPPLLPRIIADLGITSTQAGILLSVMSIVYAIAQFPSGQLSDQLTRGTLLIPGLTMLVLGFGVFALAPAYLLLVGGAVLLGIGRAAFSIPARAFIADLFGDHQGQALGIFTGASDIGGVLAAGVAVVVLSIATWQTPFLPVAGLLLVVLIGVYWWDQHPYRVARPELGIRATMRRLAGAEDIRNLLIAYTLFRFTLRGIIGFLPAFLQAAKGLSPTVATIGFSLLYVMGIPMKPAAGFVSDRVSRPAVAAGGLAISTGGFAVLLSVDAPLVILPAIAVFAAGYKGIFPVMDAFFMELSPDGSEGADLGAIRAVGSALGSLGPAYVGIVAHQASYTWAFLGLGGTLFVSTVLHGWFAFR